MKHFIWVETSESSVRTSKPCFAVQCSSHRDSGLGAGSAPSAARDLSQVVTWTSTMELPAVWVRWAEQGFRQSAGSCTQLQLDISLGLRNPLIMHGKVFGKLIVRWDIVQIVHFRPLRIYGWGECRKCDKFLQEGWFTKFAPGGTQISLDCFLFECIKLLPVLLCFSLCASRPNLRATMSLLRS